MRKKTRVDQMNEHARLHPSKTAGSEPIAKRIKLQQCRQCHRNLDQCYCTHIVLSSDDESGNEDFDRKESAAMEIEQEDESNNEVPCNEDFDRKEFAPMEIQQEDESNNDSSSNTTTSSSSSSSTTNNIATTTNSNIRGILQSYRIVQTKTGALHDKCQHICNDESRINVTYTVKVKLHDNDRDHYEIEILHRFEDELVVTSDEDDQFESQTRRSIRQKTNKMNQDTTMSNETMGDQEMALYSKRTYKMPKKSYDAISEGAPYLYDADLHNDIIVGQSEHHRILHLLERGHMFWYQVNNFRVRATVDAFAFDTA